MGDHRLVAVEVRPLGYASWVRIGSVQSQWSRQRECLSCGVVFLL